MCQVVTSVEGASSNWKWRDTEKQMQFESETFGKTQRKEMSVRRKLLWTKL